MNINTKMNEKQDFSSLIRVDIPRPSKAAGQREKNVRHITFLWNDNFCLMTARHFLTVCFSRLAGARVTGTLSTAIGRHRERTACQTGFS